jgi:hypothetical protein
MRKYKFRRWLRNWLNDFDSDGPEKAPSLTVSRNDEPDHDRCLNFRVWFANGGKVVQTNRYDRAKDRTQTSMYVVTHDQDFGAEINKIVTMEGLRG